MKRDAQHYLLLDGAQIDDLMQILYQLEPVPEFHRLYDGTRYAELAEVGPVLITTDHSSLLSQHFKEHWSTTAGATLNSRARTDELIQHLSSLVHASVSGGVSVLFRYYDPRILHLWLTDMNDGQRNTALGPVEQFQLWAHGAWHEFSRSAPSIAQHYAESPWLQLSDEQLARLNQAKQQAFEQTLLEHMDRWFPECLANAGAREREVWAKACCVRANEYGFSAVADIVRWAGLLAICGPDFPEAIEHANYRALLRQPGLLPVQKLDAVRLEAQSQALSHSKESIA